MVKFRLFDILVSGGSNSKKHLLSPNHVKLTLFLVCLFDVDVNLANESFFNPLTTTGFNLSVREYVSIIDELKTEVFTDNTNQLNKANKVTKDVKSNEPKNDY